MKSLLLVALAAFALISTANAACLRVVDGKVFNLCPFDNPIDINFNIQPYFAANMTFGLAKGNVAYCQNTTANAWFSFTNSVGKCAGASNEPTFKASPQGYFVPGLQIKYAFDDGQTNVNVQIMCNGTAPHDANINFFVDGVYDDVLYITAWSYYGCPVKAAETGRKFLQFDEEY